MTDNRSNDAGRRSTDVTTVTLQAYIDAQLGELRRAIEAAAQVPTEVVPLKDYIEQSIKGLKDYFDGVLEERRRALHSAEDERDKHIEALRRDLERLVIEGDSNLKMHSESRAQQLRSEVEATAELQKQRIESCNERVTQVMEIGAERLSAVQHELELILEASDRAIQKSEAATEKRFEALNEWRTQAAEREHSAKEQLAILTSTFLPREVAEAQFADIRRTLAELQEKVGKVV